MPDFIFFKINFEKKNVMEAFWDDLVLKYFNNDIYSSYLQCKMHKIVNSSQNP